jgi:hypothetical protein
MISFNKQRLNGLIFFLASSVSVIWLHRQYAGVMPRFVYLSGWALFAIILALTFYNARKKISFLPLLTSETWLQFHIYAGLLTGVLFLVHISYKIPTGWFEGTLAWLYVLVMASGFFLAFSFHARFPSNLPRAAVRFCSSAFPASAASCRNASKPSRSNRLVK